MNHAIQIVEEGRKSIEHFKFVMQVLEESNKKIQIADFDQAVEHPINFDPNDTQSIQIMNPIQGKRHGRPRENQFKNPIGKTLSKSINQGRFVDFILKSQLRGILELNFST